MSSGINSQKPSFIQLGALAGFIVECLASMLSFNQIQYWLKNKNELKKKLREVFAIVDEYVSIREDWQKFYQEVFNWDVDFSQVIIPEKPEGNYRLLLIAKGLKPQMAYKKCGEFFKTSCWTDDLSELDKCTNDREATLHYAVWVQDGVEAPEEHKNKSANDLKKEGHKGITLLERIVFELKFFKGTTGHLDIINWTLCAGSRYSVGGVPGAYGNSGGHGFCVGRGGPGYADDYLRSRSAV